MLSSSGYKFTVLFAKICRPIWLGHILLLADKEPTNKNVKDNGINTANITACPVRTIRVHMRIWGYWRLQKSEATWVKLVAEGLSSTSVSSTLLSVLDKSWISLKRHKTCHAAPYQFICIINLIRTCAVLCAHTLTKSFLSPEFNMNTPILGSAGIKIHNYEI